jgi:uncharacterized protein
MPDPVSRASRLDRVLADLLGQAPEVEAAAVVSFDGLPMASALPATMDEDRVAAMSAALLSLGERAAEGLGRGTLNQVYIEGEQGTVFLVSADDEGVLVAVGAKGAKVGMMLFEVKRAAAAVADVLRVEDSQPEPVSYEPPVYSEPVYEAAVPEQAPVYAEAPSYADPLGAVSEPVSYAPQSSDPSWPTYQSNGSTGSPGEPTGWS